MTTKMTNMIIDDNKDDVDDNRDDNEDSVQGFAHLLAATRPPVLSPPSKLHHIQLLPAAGAQNIVCKELPNLSPQTKFPNNPIFLKGLSAFFVTSFNPCIMQPFCRLGEVRRMPR